MTILVPRVPTTSCSFRVGLGPNNILCSTLSVFCAMEACLTCKGSQAVLKQGKAPSALASGREGGCPMSSGRKKRGYAEDRQKARCKSETGDEVHHEERMLFRMCLSLSTLCIEWLSSGHPEAFHTDLRKGNGNPEPPRGRPRTQIPKGKVGIVCSESVQRVLPKRRKKSVWTRWPLSFSFLVRSSFALWWFPLSFPFGVFRLCPLSAPALLSPTTIKGQNKRSVKRRSGLSTGAPVCRGLLTAKTGFVNGQAGLLTAKPVC